MQIKKCFYLLYNSESCNYSLSLKTPKCHYCRTSS